jgi:hypothetical protein
LGSLVLRKAANQIKAVAAVIAIRSEISCGKCLVTDVSSFLRGDLQGREVNLKV